jgi:hypothetical protein
MQDKLEKLAEVVYKKWRLERPKIEEPHLDEEMLVCFLEGRLQDKDNQRIKAHLINCDSCLEAFALNLKLKTPEIKDVPQALLERVKGLLMAKEESKVLEIILKLKEEILEIIRTTGDVLVGQEFMPACLLRSRSIKDFKDEVHILKDFRDIRVELKIENKGGKLFNLIITAKEKSTQKVLKDLRVTLIKDDIELESYLTDSGSVTFEHVFLGKYAVEISSVENKLASVLLDIKV